MKVPCYVQGWTISNIPNVLADIPYRQMTHIIYTDVHCMSSSNPDLVKNLDFISQVVARGHATGIKVLISYFGTPNDLTPIAANPTLYNSLIQNLIDIVSETGADGIDIDAAGGVSQAVQDRLITDLYNALHPAGKLVSVAVSAGKWNNEFNISLPVASLVEHIFVQCYDLGTPPYHALFDDAIAGMRLWLDAGYPKGKVIMGTPAYADDSVYAVATYAQIVDQLNPAPDQNEAYVSVINGIRNGYGQPVTVNDDVWWSGLQLTIDKAAWCNRNAGGIGLFDVGYDKMKDPQRSLLAAIAAQNTAPIMAGLGVLGAVTLVLVIIGSILRKRK